MSQLNNKKSILFINMAKGFGGGEFHTEQLIKNLEGYELCFFGRKAGKLQVYLRKNTPQVVHLNLISLLLYLIRRKISIVHALDGRGAHIAGFIKRLFNVKLMITRQVNFPFKRKSSLKAYQNADVLIGVSHSISENLSKLNKNVKTIYSCLKPLQENKSFEENYFSNKKEKLRIAQIGNFQTVKNYPLTIELAKKNQDVEFYLVGSGELERELKEQASGCDNIHFIPFTPYIGSVLKNLDLLIMPSHSEGLGQIILEGYQYGKPVIANNTGGIPEIVQHNKTGFLVEANELEFYQNYLDKIKGEPNILTDFTSHIMGFLAENDFSAKRMASEYSIQYEKLISI